MSDRTTPEEFVSRRKKGEWPNDPRPWVFLDVSYLAYRALYTAGHLEFDDSPTGVIFGLFNQIRTICTDPKVMSNRLCLFFDSRWSYRKEKFPFYKGRRRKQRKEDPAKKAILSALYSQLAVCWKKIFPDIGIPCYRQRGLESDDLIASAAKEAHRRGERAIIITGDGDLYQAITSLVTWYDPGRHKHYTPESFKAAKGLSPSDWGEVKCIAGCPGDEVPGVQHVGEKTAIKFLTGKLPSSHAAFHRIRGAKKVRKRNVELVVLPHPRTKSVVLPPRVRFSHEAFFKWCKRYGLKSLLREDKRRSWERFWRGQMGPRKLKTRRVKR